MHGALTLCKVTPEIRSSTCWRQKERTNNLSIQEQIKKSDSSQGLLYLFTVLRQPQIFEENIIDEVIEIYHSLNPGAQVALITELKSMLDDQKNQDASQIVPFRLIAPTDK